MAKTETRPERDVTIESAGDAIRSLREQANLTLQELADRVGWDKGRLSKYENNYRALSLPVIEAIAAALKLPAPVVVFHCLKRRYPGLANTRSKVGRLVQELTDALSKV